MHNVLEELAEALIGKSTTSGTGNFALSGNAPMAGDPTDHLVDGQRVFYHRYYSDFSTVGFECGHATFHAGTGQLQNKTVTRSSESTPTDPVTWTTAETYVGIYATAQAIAQWAALQLDHPPGAPNVIVISAQSNDHLGLDTEGTFPAIPAGFVKDYCTDGIGPFADSDELSFKDYVGTDEWYEYASPYSGIHRSYWVTAGTRFYQGTPPTSTAIGDVWFDTSDSGHPYEAQSIGADEITAGEWESIQGDPGWTKNASQGILTAYWLALNTGRLSLTIARTASGTNIDDATNGWAYDPGSGNTADVLNDMVTAALAETECTAWGITAPHYYLMAQGELEAAVKTSQEYAMLLSEHIDAVFNPAKWGWAVDGVTKMLVNDYPDLPSYRDTYPEFQGHALAVARHPTRAVLVPTDGLIEYYHTWDGVHLNDLGAALMARRRLNAIATTSANHSPSIGTVVFDEGAATLAPLYTFDSADDTDPSAGEANLNTAQDTLLIHKTAFGGVDATYSGIGALTKNAADDPTQAYISLTNGININWQLWIDGPVITRANWFEIPVTVKTEDVSAPVDGAVFITFVDFERPPRPVSGNRALFSLPVAPSNFAEGEEETANVRADWRPTARNENDQLVMLDQPRLAAFAPIAFSGAGTHRVFDSQMTGLNATGTVVRVEIEVHGQEDGDNTVTWAYKVSRVMRKTSTVWTPHGGSTYVEAIQDHTTSFTWVLENYNNGATNNIALRTPGITGEDHHAMGTVKIWVIEEAA